MCKKDGVETGNVFVTVEVVDPHRPLASGSLPARMRMELELDGKCILSTLLVDRLVSDAGKIAEGGGRVGAKIYHDGKLVEEVGGDERPCDPDCSFLWEGKDYTEELERAYQTHMENARYRAEEQDKAARLLAKLFRGVDPTNVN